MSDSYDKLKEQRERIEKPAPIFIEIGMERTRQRQQWGGADHDDRHDINDWFDYMRKQMHKVQYDGLEEYEREALIKIAALAIAALESHDRLAARD